MAERRRRLVQVALFTTLGLVGAFVVSVIAGLDGDPPLDGPPDARTLAERGTVRVEVLNGAGTGGLARDATARLRADGFDVVFYGNAPRFDHPRSVVIDRIGDMDRARAVAAVLAIDSVATAPDPGLVLDVSVVLGADWPGPAQAPAPLHERFRQRLLPADSMP